MEWDWLGRGSGVPVGSIFSILELNLEWEGDNPGNSGVIFMRN